MHGEERQHLAVVEPETRQLILRPGVGVPEAIPAPFAVKHNGCVQPIAQQLQVALERCARNFQIGKQIVKAHAAALMNQLIDPIDALDGIHETGIEATVGATR